MVEIRVDTKRDSDEEIRKAIRYLQSVVGDAPSAAYPSSTGSSESSDIGFDPDAAPAFTNIFGSDDDAPTWRSIEALRIIAEDPVHARVVSPAQRPADDPRDDLAGVPEEFPTRLNAVHRPKRYRPRRGKGGPGDPSARGPRAPSAVFLLCPYPGVCYAVCEV